MATDTAPPSRSEVFDALRNLRRRYVLYHLKRGDGPIGIGELAEQVAAWENDTAVDGITTKQRKSVYSALHQTHLPKLQSAGVVDYHPDRGVVEMTEYGANARLRLLCDSQTSLPWHKLYLGLSLLGLAAVITTQLGVAPFAVVPGVVYATAVAAVVGLVATGHAYDLRRWQRQVEGAAPDIILELDD